MNAPGNKVFDFVVFEGPDMLGVVSVSCCCLYV